MQATPWITVGHSQLEECPYLPGRCSRLTFVAILSTPQSFDRLMAHGYRRAGLMFYRPTCPDGCRACVPLRVRIDDYQPSRSQRRLQRQHGPRYEVRKLPAQFSSRHFDIYRRHARHVSLANDPCTPETYRAAFVDTGVQTHFFEYWIDGRLAAVSILDEGETTVSSAYSCWDPIFARYSPGTFSALWEIGWARDRGKRYYHLGYWVRDCAPMSYKNRFRPYELMSWTTGTWGKEKTGP